MKIILWLFTVFCFLFSWWWYVCPHKQVCPFGDYASVQITDPTVAPSEPAMEETTTASSPVGPLVFRWSNDSAMTSDAFPAFRDSILAALGETNKLEIVGLFGSEEVNNTSATDLGWARASQIRDLFPSLPDDRIELKSRETSNGIFRDRLFPAADFRSMVFNESVRELAGRMIINFPHASDEMLENTALNAYLDDLVERLRQTEEKVHLVGHTDNTASAARNMRLGQMRADAIKNLLVTKGLSPSRITTDSQGESNPIASNNTPDGRKENRRVELTIID